MLADDLDRRVPLENFGPFVPGDDMAVEVEQQNRVVEHIFHEQANANVARFEIV